MSNPQVNTQANTQAPDRDHPPPLAPVVGSTVALYNPMTALRKFRSNYKPPSEERQRIVDAAWKRVVEMAKLHIERSHLARHFSSTSATPYGFRTSTDSLRSTVSTASSRSTSSTTSTSSTVSSSTDASSAAAPGPEPPRRLRTYERERLMADALEELFRLVNQGSGYLSYLISVSSELEYDNPVVMAFLCHTIEKTSLPSRDTMKSVSAAIIYRVAKVPTRLRRMLSVLANRPKIERSLSTRSLNQTLVRRNAAILWSLLAEKYAGDLCLLIWNDTVRDYLIGSLADSDCDTTVRLFSLLALEKFAATGPVKTSIMAYEPSIRDILINVLEDCEQALDPTRSNGYINRFIPANPESHMEWAAYLQLNLSAKWALDRIFILPRIPAFPWNLDGRNLIMNPFDTTPKMKLCSNGLEFRNDSHTFESVRGTACVKRGVWYYEALVLTSGIMQIGWATSKCRFSPEEGLGVGDDRNGFAFDTFRASVWAAAQSVHPVPEHKYRCKPGDVIGTLLDLKEGTCTYFINGVDYGICVEFERPKTQERREQVRAEIAALEAREALQNKQYTVVTSDESEEPVEEPIEPKPAKSLGLYPAVSLTTGQHVLCNFGDNRWFCPPQTERKFRAIAEAGYLDDEFKKNVMRWIKKRGVTAGTYYRPLNKQPLRPLYGADKISRPATPLSSCESDYEDDDEYDSSDVAEEESDDEGLCSLCYSEPGNVTLEPCGHAGFGAACARIIDLCPLCRSEIKKRKATEL